MAWPFTLFWIVVATPGTLVPHLPVTDAVKSPSGRLVATLRLDTPSGGLGIEVSLDGRPLVRTSDLGIEFKDAPPFSLRLEIAARDLVDRMATYEYAFGKRRDQVDQHRELVWTLREDKAPWRTADFHLRVHDDGVSYRWHLASWPGTTEPAVTQERARHLVAGNPRAFPLYRKHFRTSHEGAYVETRREHLVPDRLVDLPLLFARDDGRFLAFTEADVRGYPHAYLTRTPGNEAALEMRLSPRIDDPDIAARVTVPFRTPWRSWMVGTSLAALLESDLPLHLSEPSRIADTSWIEPGKQTWHWWNGTVSAAADEGGLNFETMRAYVDFCADSGIRFHAVNGEKQPWYLQSRNSVLPSADANVLEPRPELEWDRLRAHAKKRGVKLRLWAHWKALAPDLEAAFALYEQWGVAGLMVDFLDRDDQEMVAFCERVLEVAARHHLTVSFHGSFKPTGLRRTWPNLMNHEGAANLEVLKWADGCDPDHDLIVPFTRGLAGPVDYHLGGFRAVRRVDFTPRNQRPNVFGTRARALAYYVVLENPLPMVCDFPEAYHEQPGFDFVAKVPTTWDESCVLSAAIGDHIVWARRKGDTWYLGALTDWTARDLTIRLDFLGPGQHDLRLFSDSGNPAAHPDTVVEQRRRVAAGGTLRLSLAPGGGAAAVIR